MRVVQHSSPAAFLERAREFLGAYSHVTLGEGSLEIGRRDADGPPEIGRREAEHHLILGIVGGLADGPPPGAASQPFLATVEEGNGRIVAAAMRTPPFNLVLSVADEEAAPLLLANHRAEGDPELRGVLGPPEESAAFAGRYAQRSGRAARPGMRQGIYRLGRVRDPRPAAGKMRMAQRADRTLAESWFAAFQRDVWGPETTPGEVAAMVDRWLGDAPGRALYFWDVAGRAVSMTAASGATPRGIRIGAVYTPPEVRGRGYASNLVAAVSRAQLDSGRTYCFLYTDLANPTSNHIYEAIGYEFVSEAHEYVFSR